MIIPIICQPLTIPNIFQIRYKSSKEGSNGEVTVITLFSILFKYMISALREKESLVLIQDIPEEQSFHKPDKQEKLLTVIVKEEAGKRTI